MLRENRLLRKGSCARKKLQKLSLCSAGVLIASWASARAGATKSGFSTGELLIHAIMFSGAFLCFISKPPWRVAITSAVSSLSARIRVIQSHSCFYLVLALWVCNHQHHFLCIQACTRQPIFLFHVSWFFGVLFGFSGFVFCFSTFSIICVAWNTHWIFHIIHSKQEVVEKHILFIFYVRFCYNSHPQSS